MHENYLLDAPIEGLPTSNHARTALRLFQISLGLLIIGCLSILLFWNNEHYADDAYIFSGFIIILIVPVSLAGLIYGILSYRKKEPKSRWRIWVVVGNSLMFLLFGLIMASAFWEPTISAQG